MSEHFYKVEWEAVKGNRVVDSGTSYFRSSHPATLDDFKRHISHKIQMPASAIFLPTYGPTTREAYEAHGGEIITEVGIASPVICCPYCDRNVHFPGVLSYPWTEYNLQPFFCLRWAPWGLSSAL